MCRIAENNRQKPAEGIFFFVCEIPLFCLKRADLWYLFQLLRNEYVDQIISWKLSLGRKTDRRQTVVDVGSVGIYLTYPASLGNQKGVVIILAKIGTYLPSSLQKKRNQVQLESLV